MSKKRIVIIDDRWFLSLVRDFGTLLTGIIMILFASYFENEAFEWIGAVIFFLSLGGLGSNQNYTINEARSILDEMEAIPNE